MNGSKAKMNRGGANKMKSSIGAPLITIKCTPNVTDEKHSSIVQFLNTSSAEEQLAILKNMIDKHKEASDDEIINFLVNVFYEAPAKHPIKCFLSRHVTKCSSIQESFTNFLTAHIVSDISRDAEKDCEFEYYEERVPKIMMCIENFPSGALSVERLDVKFLTQHLFFNYFSQCRTDLWKSTLSPTEKNKMCSLEHTMLRLVIHSVQNMKLDERERNAWDKFFNNITDCVEMLIIDEEVPMDTKSLSGILLLLVETLSTGSSTDACNKLLEGSPKLSGRVLRLKHGQLAVYCAIATTVSLEQLQGPVSREQIPAVVMLLDKLLSFADGSASEPAEAVAVARALLQLSRSLSALGDWLGGRATSRLLRFVWPHLDFHLDSVRHLAQQILANCLDYCAGLEKRGDGTPLEGLLVSVRKLRESRSLYWALSHACAALGAARALRELSSAHALLRAAAAPHLQAAASAAISALLSSGACAGLEASEVFATWVRPALPSPPALQAALPPALAACPALPHYIASQVRGREALACARAAPQCRATISRRALRAAAIHADDETRIAALSLAGCPRGGGAGAGRAGSRELIFLSRKKQDAFGEGLSP